MKIRIQHSNIYTFNRYPIDTLRRVWRMVPYRQPDSIGINEGGRSIGKLKTTPGYRLFWKRAASRHTKNNPILVNKNRPVLAKKFFRIVPGTGRRVTPPRNAQVVIYKKGGRKIAHINTHFHVVPEDRLPYISESKYPRSVKQYVKQVRFIRDLMRKYKQQGYIVFVTCDGNTRPRAGHKDWKYAAYVYLNAGDFKVTRNDLDLIVHDTSKVELESFKVIDRRYLGMADHDSLFGVYRVKE